jgi:hypothetical protein
MIPNVFVKYSIESTCFAYISVWPSNCSTKEMSSKQNLSDSKCYCEILDRIRGRNFKQTKKQVLIPPEKCTTLFLQSPIKSIVQTNWNQNITLKSVSPKKSKLEGRWKIRARKLYWHQQAQLVPIVSLWPWTFHISKPQDLLTLQCRIKIPSKGYMLKFSPPSTNPFGSCNESLLIMEMFHV